jgi:nitroimidazol reductase NimA-like FMN-containing flavoprotein (pyridoxamine 5'-phosphate oxidase superfamily)
MEYESVIGCGEINVSADSGGKLRGLKAIMRHYAGEKDFSFNEAELEAVCVLRLDVARITGKRLKKPARENG